MVVSEFIRSMPGKIVSIKTDHQKQNITGLIQKAHSMRGSASTIGADAISKAALEIEKAGDIGDMEAFLKKINLLEDEFKRFADHINTMEWSNL